jgi:hypothetical protein
MITNNPARPTAPQGRTVTGVRASRGNGSGGAAAEVVSITSAPTSHSDDLDKRISRYLTSMAIRTVCVVLVVVIDSPVRWVFAVGALVLPYVAVVMANVHGERHAPPPPVSPHTPRGSITDSPSGDAPGRSGQ